MAGAVKQFGDYIGETVKGKPKAPAPAPASAPAAQAAPQAAGQAATGETGERRRIARRGGRVLLSEARIAPETGLQQTLGSGM